MFVKLEKDLLFSKLVVPECTTEGLQGFPPPAQQQQQQPGPGSAPRIPGRMMEEPCKPLRSQERLSATT